MPISWRPSKFKVMKKRLKPPKFEEDLKTFDKKPIWMNQMERTVNSDEPVFHLIRFLVAIAFLVAIGLLLRD